MAKIKKNISRLLPIRNEATILVAGIAPVNFLHGLLSERNR